VSYLSGLGSKSNPNRSSCPLESDFERSLGGREEGAAGRGRHARRSSWPVASADGSTATGATGAAGGSSGGVLRAE
jgi:hypothetical protein